MLNFIDSITKKVLSVLAIGAAGALVYELIIVPNSPSHFQAASAKLGFANPRQDEALLKIFYMSGYLNQDELWKQLYRSQAFSKPEAVFKQAIEALHKAGSKKDLSQFDASRAAKNLFGKTMPHLWEMFGSRTNTDDVEKLIVYMGQSAFDRQKNQERTELNHSNWMQEYSTRYMAEARALGLIEPTHPDFDKTYTAAMIQGASRPGFFPRVILLREYLEKKLSVETIVALAGNRELWAEIDGISPELLTELKKASRGEISLQNIQVVVASSVPNARAEEGKEYIQALAKTNGITLDPENPIIERNGRSYPNYQEDNSKLTEYHMALDILKEVGLKAHKVHDTQAFGEGVARPDTATTSASAAKDLVSSIISTGNYEGKTFHILSVSNNPYIERQAIVLQRATDEAIKASHHEGDFRIVVNGVGFGCKQDVTAIHSALGALIAEKHIAAYPSQEEQDFYYSHLQFQGRDNDIEVPDMPILGEG